MLKSEEIPVMKGYVTPSTKIIIVHSEGVLCGSNEIVGEEEGSGSFNY
jgi:hypothetical protein